MSAPAAAPASDPTPGAQRLSIAQLEAWRAMGLGMFLHFGMSTFDGDELSKGDKPSTQYAPDALDVGQWIAVARDAGCKYAVLTTKHVAGHCLWPTQYNDYHVGTSGNTTDVVEAFLKACGSCGVKPGFYYCSWDNHNRFGSMTPTFTKFEQAFTTQAYRDFQFNQIGELIARYGPVAEWWIDIPMVLPRDYRATLYDAIAKRQPEAVIVMNQGFGDGSELKIRDVWPTDVVTIERWLPNSEKKFQPWREVEGRKYFLGGEVCDPIGKDWFYTDVDQPRSDAELLGMLLVSQSRGANLLLNVGPDRHGQIASRFIAALQRLRKNLDRLGL